MPIGMLVRRVGEALLPAHEPARRALLGLPPGRLLRASISRPRSRKQHGRVFAAIDEAVRHWPDSHDLAPEDAEHLRAWLLCKVGHVETPFIDVPVPDKADPITIALQVAHHMEAARRRNKYAFARPGRQRIRIYVPATINWDDVDQPTFAPVAQAIFEEIETVLGVTVEKLLEERQARARSAAEAAEEMEAA